jgi:hypothetical protein
MPEPMFRDHCGHGIECYVGSFSHDSKKYDVYVYDDHVDHASVCIRYGDEDYEYMSAGSLLGMAKRSHNFPIYQKALELIEEKGRLAYYKKKT